MPAKDTFGKVGLKGKLSARFKNVKYKFTGARKAALMKAVKASALKRKQQAKAAGNNLAAAARKTGASLKKKATLRVRGAGMKVRSAYKQNKAKKGSVVQKAIVARNKARNKKNVMVRKAKKAVGYISAPKNASKLRQRQNVKKNVSRIARNKVSAAKTTVRNKVKSLSGKKSNPVSLRGKDGKIIKVPNYNGKGNKPRNSLVTKAKATTAKLTKGTSGLNSGSSTRSRGSGAGAAAARQRREQEQRRKSVTRSTYRNVRRKK